MRRYIYPLIALPVVIALVMMAPRVSEPSAASESAVTSVAVTSGAASSATAAVPIATSLISDPARGERLLKEIRSDALQVREHADVMKSLIRFPTSYHWQTHAFELTQIREGVNDMGKNLGELQMADREAARSLIPLQVSLVAHTEEAIRFTEKRTFANFWDPDYKGHVEGIHDRSDQIARSVDESMLNLSGN
ncbi:MAG: hypothetical protein HYX74_09020 [Acidobacteria bacterium]|nr:hypothetical protein [Acidobacteriota bacterium]